MAAHRTTVRVGSAPDTAPAALKSLKPKEGAAGGAAGGAGAAAGAAGGGAGAGGGGASASAASSLPPRGGAAAAGGAAEAAAAAAAAGKKKGWQPKVFIIGVSGGTASGKTSVCTEIEKRLGSSRVAIISQDSFYKSLSPDEKAAAASADYNFDHPKAFDFDALLECLVNLAEGRAAHVPHYDFVTHSRTSESTQVAAVDVLLVEGILAFYDERVRNMMQMKLFVDTDADVRLARRVRRDIAERGRDVDGVLLQYERFVKPAFDEFISPTKKFCDVIIPRGADNLVAIELITQHIRSMLDAARRSMNGSGTQFALELDLE